jgi:hypothetical protein
MPRAATLLVHAEPEDDLAPGGVVSDLLDLVDAIRGDYLDSMVRQEFQVLR